MSLAPARKPAPPPATDGRLSRRGTLAAVVAAALPAPALAAPALAAPALAAPALAAEASPAAGGGADAALLALCAEIERLQAESDRLTAPFHAMPVDDPHYSDPATGLEVTCARLEPGVVRMRALARAIGALPAATVPGMAAKAALLRAALDVSAAGGPFETAGREKWLAWSLARDVLALAGARGVA